MSNLPEKSNFLGYQAQKAQKTLDGVPHLRIPRALYDLRKVLSPSEFVAMLALWDYFQSPRVKHPEKFTTSRAHLAQEASVSDTASKGCLQKLQRLGALQLVSRKVGEAGTYKWNSAYLRGGLGEIHPGVGLKTPRGLGEKHPAVGCISPSVYITSLLIHYIPLYSALSGHSDDVENRGQGELKGRAPRGLPDGKVAALRSAVEHLWKGAGAQGAWPLHDIHALLYSFKVNIYKVDSLTEYMRKLLRDGVPVYNFRKQNPEHFKTEEELLAHLDQLDQLDQLKEAGHGEEARDH